MLQLIGIKKHVNIHIREKLTLLPQKLKMVLNKLSSELDEVVILSTCNRTEIYINDRNNNIVDLEKVFEILEWNKEYMDYCFIAKDDLVIKHLMEVTAGFHSRILGEDQILGQVKNAYQIALEYKTINGELQRLFEDALSCGKKFKTESRLYDIPVSASSISISKAVEHKVKNLMIIGYGDVGKLVVKYALASNFDNIYLLIRDKNKACDIKDERIKIIGFDEKDSYINEVDGIISCTASPHVVIKKTDINPVGKEIVIFDLAVPRDVDKCLKNLTRVKLYDIDDIGILDGENRKLRKERMDEYQYIVDEYFVQYNNWISSRSLSNDIRKIKETERVIVDERLVSFKNRCNDKSDVELAEVLIKSTSDYYVNRAIATLKEARINGCEEECLKIIEKIFMMD